ncbi:hypothetical protein K435DRAFT_606054, partial [Dendrothele bispora CBS 962.96]
FGEFVLSFNSNDHLASVCTSFPFPFHYAYSKWLKTVARWIGSSPPAQQPIYNVIKENTGPWSGFGAYLTSILLAQAGLRFWMPTKDVCKSPARMARLCEAAFHIFWEGH